MQRIYFLMLIIFLSASCNNNNKSTVAGKDVNDAFNNFQPFFLDAYWKENPSSAIFAGYGKYYDELTMPDSTAFAQNVLFLKQWLDSLHGFNYNDLSDDNKINYNIIQNQLQSAVWYIDTFKSQQRDPSSYNLGGECYYLLTQNYAPLTQRLQTLSKHLQHAADYYSAAEKIINHPTKEYTELAIQQNQGSLDVFGASLSDSIQASSLTDAEKDSLQQHILTTTSAIKNYISFLKKLVADKNHVFSNFRIGKELFAQKFKYDLVTDFMPEQMFAKADSAKNYYHKEMFRIANELWTKYYGNAAKPADSLALIKAVLNKLSLNHATPQHVVDTATKLVHDLERFIITKNLFNYDTTTTLKVRIMPAFMAGVSLANAEFIPPYQKTGTTYYNVMDLSKMPATDAESELKEYNTYSLQFLSMHEAMPGHCMQGVYNNKSGSIIKSVFGNGAMIEGWAVYCEQMMMENGWGNNAPELWLVLYKWRLRECSNVLIDYGIQCLNYSDTGMYKLLKNETFQEDAQIKEKYHRATVSQVQLCSYFTGLSDILALREAYKNKTGSSNYNLKDFHEKFLSYGSAPVKYIREVIMR